MGSSIVNAFKGGTVSVGGFGQSLQRLGGIIKAVQVELAAISLSGGLLVKQGLQAADSYRVLQARFEGITGSQAKALDLMERLEVQARRFGQPVRETQTTLAGVVKQLEDAGENVEDFVGIAARLRLVDPTAQAFDVQVALREAISGNFMSLQRRFEFPPAKEIERLVEETGSLSAALDIILTDMGASSEVAEAMGQSYSAAAANLRSTFVETLERAFTPSLDKAAGALNFLNGVLESTPDGLLAIGGTAAIAVTGLASMTLAVSQLLTSYQNLQKAGFFTNFASVGRNIARAGVGAGAVALGTGIGIGAVQTFGAATGNERLRNFGLEEAGNTLKQAIFLIVNQLIEAGRFLAQAFRVVIENIQGIPNAFNRFRGQLEVSFAGVLTAFANFIANIPGSDEAGAVLRGIADNLRASGEQRIADASGQRLVGLGSFEQEQQSPGAAIDAQFDAFQRDVAEMFGFIEEQAEETNEIVKSATKSSTTVIEQQNEAYLAGLQSRISFEQQYIELLREGTPEQVQDRIQALKDEKAAIEQFLPQLEAIAATSDEAAEELANYRDRLSEIDRQSGQLGTALLAATERAIEATNTDIGKLDTDFAAEVAKIEGERQKALNEAFDDLKQNLTELDADVLKKSRELGAENIEALEEYQEREREIVAEHRERVLSIERKSREDIIDAAARLDAAGVFSARKAREEQLTEADKQFNEERNKNAAKLAETQKNLAEEAAALQAYYIERRNQLIAENQADIIQLNEKFNAELQTAETAYQQERTKLQQHLAQLVGMRISASAQEANAVRQGLQATQQAFSGFFSSLAQQASQLSSAIQKAAVVTKAPTTINSISSSGSFGGSTVQRAVAQPVRFNTGGVTSFAGSGSALAFVENKERILTPAQNANFERFVNAIPGSGTATPQPPTIPDNLTVDVTGVDSFEALVQRVTLRVIGLIHQRQIAGG